MTRKHLLGWVLTLALAAAGLPGCGGGADGGGGTSGAAPALRIAVTDAPFPFEAVQHATVEVQRIDIRRAGGGFETLRTFDGGRTLDLVALRNGVTEVLFEGDPGPGEYDALRIVVLPREVVIDEDGTSRSITDFAVPSGPQTGIKVFVDPAITVSTELTRDLVLDFDLSRSFVVQGNPATPAGIRSFHFQPVIRAVNASTAGSLTFRVLSDNGTADEGDDFGLDGAAYTVLDPSTEPPTVVVSGATGPDPDAPSVHGYAFHPAIPAGTYELEVEATGHTPVTVPVTIEAANLTDAGTLTLAAAGRVIAGTVTTTLETAAGETLTFAVEGAAVTAGAAGVAAATDTTNGFGAYLLSPPAEGTYDVAANKAGYVEAAAAGVAPWIYGSGASPVDLVLVPATGLLTVKVTDAADQPVDGATVRALVAYADPGSGTASEREMATATAGAESGTYEFSSLPTGTYVIRAEVTVDGETRSATADAAHVGGAPSTVTVTLP